MIDSAGYWIGCFVVCVGVELVTQPTFQYSLTGREHLSICSVILVINSVALSTNSEVFIEGVCT